MSTEGNKALVRQFLTGQHQGDLALLDQLLAPDSQLYLPGTPAPMDRESTKQFFATFHSAFPDETLTIEDQIAEGDLVATRVTVRATQHGAFQGIPPTGNPVTITGIGIHRIDRGQIVEHWPLPDFTGLMQQLGVIPTPGEAAA